MVVHDCLMANRIQQLNSRLLLLGCLLLSVQPTTAVFADFAIAPADVDSSPREVSLLKLLAKRELVDHGCKKAFNCTGTHVLVPPAGARVLELSAPPMSSFSVDISATAARTAPEPMSRWPMQLTCGGHALMAMGFRADKVPAGFLVPKSNATRALLNRPVPLTNTADWDPDSLSRWQQSSTKNTCRDFWVPAASMLTWAQQQQQHLGGSVVLWPPEGGVESGSLQWSSTATSRQVTSNLKGKTTSGLLRECGPCGSRVYVYIYNCFTSPDALLLVKVNLTQHSTDYYDQCYTTRDKTVAFTQGFSVFCMVLCAVAFFLPLSISVYAAARRAWDRRRAKNRADQGEVKPPKPLKPAPTYEPSSRHWLMYKSMLTTMHSPSGYSRLYTVTLVIMASLLIACTVWPPDIDPRTQHDHAWFDNVIAPRRSPYQHNHATMITYYLKIMSLSALIGHTVKLALLANLSPPDLCAKGVCVDKRVWGAQRLVACLGLLVLLFLTGSTLSYMLLQAVKQVWVACWSYYWMMVCIVANLIVAVAAFVWSHFIRPPALSTPDIKDLHGQAAPGPLGEGVEQHPQQQPQQQAQSRTPNMDMQYRRSVFEDIAAGRPYHTEDSHAAAPAPAPAPVPTPQPVANGAHTVDLSGVSVKQDKSAEQHAAEEPPERQGCCTKSGAGCSSMWAAVRGFPALFRTAVLEEPKAGIRYTSWVLAPVWLTFYLIVFWWLMGVEQSGIILDCLSDPVACVGGGHVLDFADPAMAGDKIKMLRDMMAGSSMLAIDQLGNSSMAHGDMQSRWIYQLSNITALANAYDFSTLTYPPGASSARPTAAHDVYRYYQDNLAFARLVGRWVGYSVAAFFACVSLIRIVMSFKSSITLNAKWERYWEEHPEEKALVEQAGATQHSEEARQLILDAQDMAKKMGAPSQTYHYATLIVQGKQSSPFIAALGAPAAASAAPTAPGAAAAAAPQAAAAAGAALLGQAVGLGLSRNEIQPVSGVSDGVPRLTKSKKSSAAAPPGATETGLSSRLMEMLQRHEEDMNKVGIGTSVALFGVLISTMWIQIRLIGLFLTIGFTMIAHPMFWNIALENGWIVAVVCLIGLVAFNIIVVKVFIGSMVLSDGRFIRHPGTWMTYFLMFQLGFMVVGWLYSLWRILIALIIMLLYSVAALDRSMMHAAQILDGPYRTFLASVKLEQAYRHISKGLPFPEKKDDGDSRPGQGSTQQAGSKDVDGGPACGGTGRDQAPRGQVQQRHPAGAGAAGSGAATPPAVFAQHHQNGSEPIAIFVQAND